MIPEEATDEAAEAIRANLKTKSIWDVAKAALEAAAPFIRAQAWDEGYVAGKLVMVELMSPTHFATEVDNPYRSE
jgi:hypothetical protein